MSEISCWSYEAKYVREAYSLWYKIVKRYAWYPEMYWCPTQGVLLPHAFSQYSWGRLCIHCDPAKDNALTEDEWKMSRRSSKPKATKEPMNNTLNYSAVDSVFWYWIGLYLSFKSRSSKDFIFFCFGFSVGSISEKHKSFFSPSRVFPIPVTCPRKMVYLGWFYSIEPVLVLCVRHTVSPLLWALSGCSSFKIIVSMCL